MEVAAPTDEAVQAELHKFIRRMMKLFTRQGVLVGEQGETYLADVDAGDDSDESRAQAFAGRSLSLSRSIRSTTARPTRRWPSWRRIPPKKAIEAVKSLAWQRVAQQRLKLASRRVLQAPSPTS